MNNNYIIERLAFFLLQKKQAKNKYKFQITKKLLIEFCILNDINFRKQYPNFQIKNAPKYNVLFFCEYCKNVSK